MDEQNIVDIISLATMINTNMDAAKMEIFKKVYLDSEKSMSKMNKGDLLMLERALNSIQDMVEHATEVDNDESSSSTDIHISTTIKHVSSIFEIIKSVVHSRSLVGSRITVSNKKQVTDLIKTGLVNTLATLMSKDKSCIKVENSTGKTKEIKQLTLAQMMRKQADTDSDELSDADTNTSSDDVQIATGKSKYLVQAKQQMKDAPAARAEKRIKKAARNVTNVVLDELEAYEQAIVDVEQEESDETAFVVDEPVDMSQIRNSAVISIIKRRGKKVMLTCTTKNDIKTQLLTGNYEKVTVMSNVKLTDGSIEFIKYCNSTRCGGRFTMPALFAFGSELRLPVEMFVTDSIYNSREDIFDTRYCPGMEEDVLYNIALKMHANTEGRKLTFDTQVPIAWFYMSFDSYNEANTMCGNTRNAVRSIVNRLARHLADVAKITIPAGVSNKISVSIVPSRAPIAYIGNMQELGKMQNYCVLALPHVMWAKSIDDNTLVELVGFATTYIDSVRLSNFQQYRCDEFGNYYQSFVRKAEETTIEDKFLNYSFGMLVESIRSLLEDRCDFIHIVVQCHETIDLIRDHILLDRSLAHKFEVCCNYTKREDPDGSKTKAYVKKGLGNIAKIEVRVMNKIRTILDAITKVSDEKTLVIKQFTSTTRVVKNILTGDLGATITMIVDENGNVNKEINRVMGNRHKEYIKCPDHDDFISNLMNKDLGVVVDVTNLITSGIQPNSLVSLLGYMQNCGIMIICVVDDAKDVCREFRNQSYGLKIATLNAGHDDLLSIEIAMQYGCTILTRDKMSEFVSKPTYCSYHKRVLIRHNESCTGNVESNTRCNIIQVDMMPLFTTALEHIQVENKVIKSYTLSKPYFRQFGVKSGNRDNVRVYVKPIEEDYKYEICASIGVKLVNSIDHNRSSYYNMTNMDEIKGYFNKCTFQITKFANATIACMAATKVIPNIKHDVLKNMNEVLSTEEHKTCAPAIQVDWHPVIKKMVLKTVMGYEVIEENEAGEFLCNTGFTLYNYTGKRNLEKTMIKAWSEGLNYAEIETKNELQKIVRAPIIAWNINTLRHYKAFIYNSNNQSCIMVNLTFEALDVMSRALVCSVINTTGSTIERIVDLPIVGRYVKQVPKGIIKDSNGANENKTGDVSTIDIATNIESMLKIIKKQVRTVCQTNLTLLQDVKLVEEEAIVGVKSDVISDINDKKESTNQMQIKVVNVTIKNVDVNRSTLNKCITMVEEKADIVLDMRKKNGNMVINNSRIKNGANIMSSIINNILDLCYDNFYMHVESITAMLTDRKIHRLPRTVYDLRVKVDATSSRIGEDICLVMITNTHRMSLVIVGSDATSEKEEDREYRAVMVIRPRISISSVLMDMVNGDRVSPISSDCDKLHELLDKHKVDDLCAELVEKNMVTHEETWYLSMILDAYAPFLRYCGEDPKKHVVSVLMKYVEDPLVKGELQLMRNSYIAIPKVNVADAFSKFRKMNTNWQLTNCVYSNIMHRMLSDVHANQDKAKAFLEYISKFTAMKSHMIDVEEHIKHCTAKKITKSCVDILQHGIKNPYKYSCDKCNKTINLVQATKVRKVMKEGGTKVALCVGMVKHVYEMNDIRDISFVATTTYSDNETIVNEIYENTEVEVLIIKTKDAPTNRMPKAIEDITNKYNIVKTNTIDISKDEITVKRLLGMIKNHKGNLVIIADDKYPSLLNINKNSEEINIASYDLRHIGHIIIPDVLMHKIFLSLKPYMVLSDVRRGALPVVQHAKLVKVQDVVRRVDFSVVEMSDQSVKLATGVSNLKNDTTMIDGVTVGNDDDEHLDDTSKYYVNALNNASKLMKKTSHIIYALLAIVIIICANVICSTLMPRRKLMINVLTGIMITTIGYITIKEINV